MPDDKRAANGKRVGRRGRVSLTGEAAISQQATAKSCPPLFSGEGFTAAVSIKVSKVGERNKQQDAREQPGRLAQSQQPQNAKQPAIAAMAAPT
jgi:hypothetical protein